MLKVKIGDVVKLDDVNVFFMEGAGESSFWRGSLGIVCDIYDNKLSVIDDALKVVGPVSNKCIEIISSYDKNDK